jgi:hypothetical protein
MRNWLQSIEYPRALPPPRPIVLIEDNLHDAFEFVKVVASVDNEKEDLLGALTVVLLAAPGLDTKRDVLTLLCKYPRLQVTAGPFQHELASQLDSVCKALATSSAPSDPTLLSQLLQLAPRSVAATLSNRFGEITNSALTSYMTFVSLIDSVVRPGGMVMCDIELPLSFTLLEFDKRLQRLRGAKAAAEACALQSESCEVHASLTPIVQDPARLNVLSGLTDFLCITLDFEDVKVRIDQSQVFRKSVPRDMERAMCCIRELLRTRFPWTLTVRHGRKRAASDTEQSLGPIAQYRVGPNDLAYTEAAVDVLLWSTEGRSILQGRAALPEGWKLAGAGAAGRTFETLVQRHLQEKRRMVAAMEIEAQLAASNANQSAPHVIRTIKDHLRSTKQSIVLDARVNWGQYGLSPAYSVGMVVPQSVIGRVERPEP